MPHPDENGLAYLQQLLLSHLNDVPWDSFKCKKPSLPLTIILRYMVGAGNDKLYFINSFGSAAGFMVVQYKIPGRGAPLNNLTILFHLQSHISYKKHRTDVIRVFLFIRSQPFFR
jgi:hypothetical protein